LKNCTFRFGDYTDGNAPTNKQAREFIEYAKEIKTIIHDELKK